MSAPDLSANMMAQFRDSGAEKHTTILLGAGASTTSGLPTWDEFAARLLHMSGSVSSLGAAELLVAHQDPLLVAEAARAAAGDRWEQILRRALYEGVQELDVSSLHLAAVGHLLTGASEDTKLVTLNFDTLLEQAIESEKALMVPVVDGDAVTNQAHHLHGVIALDRVDDVVLTLTDFTDLVSRENSWQLDLLRDSIARGALIIAGTSYRDPDLRQWLHTVLAQRPERHAAVVLLARQGFALSKDDFSAIERALVDQWKSVGMRPVLLQDHSDAAQIIRELRHVNKADYVSPQQRARLVWEAHATEFARLQRRYSDQLAMDAEVLRNSLTADRLNLTLWLADGEGGIARWATQDRYYRSVTDLRVVETGHDSRWIAGRALGSESVLFKNVEDGFTVRWRSVLALSIPVQMESWPPIATAVLSVGLPDLARTYESSTLLWSEALAGIADDWSTRLVEALYGQI